MLSTSSRKQSRTKAQAKNAAQQMRRLRCPKHKWRRPREDIWSYCTEYWQEMKAIEALKRATPLTDTCMEGYAAGSMSWTYRVLFHFSGLQDMAERDCWEQLRVASMLNYPNPLHCLVNLFWKTAVGDSPLGHIFSRQSYFVQCVLIFAGAGMVAALVYNFALRIPRFFSTLVQLPDLHQREVYNELQQQLRERPVHMPPAALAAYKRAAREKKQKQRDWKLAMYALYKTHQKHT
jgi:hypothetical protein